MCWRPPQVCTTQRTQSDFYITVLNYELDQGVHLGSSQLLIASSISSNPADGFLGPYSGSCLTSLHLAHHESTLSTGHAVVC